MHGSQWISFGKNETGAFEVTRDYQAMNTGGRVVLKVSGVTFPGYVQQSTSRSATAFNNSRKKHLLVMMWYFFFSFFLATELYTRFTHLN